MRRTDARIGRYIANASSRVIASSFVTRTARRVAASDVGPVFHVSFVSPSAIGIRRCFVTLTVARRDARALKHLKHETSTKRQCAATIRLEMTGPVRLTRGLVSNSEFANERAWRASSLDMHVGPSGRGPSPPTGNRGPSV